MGSNLAAIDMGTNSFHLVVVSVSDQGSVQILTKEKEMVRLGSGAGDMEIITEEAMGRGIAALSRFRKIADSHKAEIRAVATSATREARNQNEFLHRIKTATDLDIEVVSGLEEARLIYRGILQGLPVFDKKILMFDIGGGSTEFLIGHKGVPAESVSAKLGAIRLTDRFFSKEPLKMQNVEDCRKYIQTVMSSFLPRFRELKSDFAVGSSGTIETIAAMTDIMNGSDPLKEPVIKKADLDAVVNRILSHPTAKSRSQIPGLDEKRADIIIAGAVLLQEIFRAFDLKEVHYSSYALREGVIFDTLDRKGAFPAETLSDIRRRSAQELLDRFLSSHPDEIASSYHCAKLSLRLTEELQKLGFFKNITGYYKDLLYYAAVLHNIGISVSYSSHHKHSQYIIKNTDILTGFTKLETEIISVLTRFHRKSSFSKKPSIAEGLPPVHLEPVKILSALLRVGVSLDRSRDGAVSDLNAEKTGNTITVKMCPCTGDHELAVFAADQKKEELESLIGHSVTFVTSKTVSC